MKKKKKKKKKNNNKKKTKKKRCRESHAPVRTGKSRDSRVCEGRT